VYDASVRYGCVIVTLDLRESLCADRKASPTAGLDDQSVQALAAAAQTWLRDAQLSEQLPPSGPVFLQVRWTHTFSYMCY